VADSGLHLTVPNDRQSIDQVRLAVLDYLAGNSPSAKAIFHTELILEESLMNVIWHGFDEAGEQAIDVYVSICGGDIALRFEDAGRAFDPTHRPDPRLPASLDEASPGGLGLLLVRKFAKSVHYERLGGRNRLTICIPMH
jgi:anti-sigma regulatory factor (Ser/Thr protein kinase)